MYPTMPAAPMLDPRYVDGLKRKRETVTRMCNAIEDFLCFDIDAALDVSSLPREPLQPRCTPEMLVNAQADLQQMETQLQTLKDSLAKAKDKLPEELSSIISMQETMTFPMMERDIDFKRAQVTYFQNQLDGKFFSVACSKCYGFLNQDGSVDQSQSSSLFSGTQSECDSFARENGWSVGEDSESHTCRKCAAL